jgi:hypothetical protein
VEVICSSQMLGTLKITWRYNPEDCNLHSHRGGNLKCNINICCFVFHICNWLNLFWLPVNICSWALRWSPKQVLFYKKGFCCLKPLINVSGM